jgi:hypothetical protein
LSAAWIDPELLRRLVVRGFLDESVTDPAEHDALNYRVAEMAARESIDD